MTPLLTRTMLVSLIALLGCTTTIEKHGGFPVFSEIKPAHGFSYHLDAKAPAPVKDLLFIAVNHWNDALGQPLLNVTTSASKADVKIIYSQTETVMPSPAHAELLGCMKGFGLADCKIVLKGPKKIATADDMKRLAHLFTQGPLDPKM